MAELDLDKRVLALEMKAEFINGEISSLRSSRHEHGNWLNRHNLEISAVDQTVRELLQQRLSAVEVAVDAHGKKLNELESNAKVQAWKIGSILAGLVFVANQVAFRIHLF